MTHQNSLIWKTNASDKPERATNEAGARALCKKRGTGQCAAVCLQYTHFETAQGRCPEAMKVWGKKS